MTVAELKELAQSGRMEALATRDPIAIRMAQGRWRAVEAAILGRPDDEVLDLSSTAVGVKVAAEALGYTPQQVRKLIKERRLVAHKAGDQWRIPLRSLL